MPKNRQTIFCVVRCELSETGFGEQYWDNPVVCASTFSLERAEELAGKYAQEMEDAGIANFGFEVQTTTYYDE